MRLYEFLENFRIWTRVRVLENGHVIFNGTAGDVPQRILSERDVVPETASVCFCEVLEVVTRRVSWKEDEDRGKGGVNELKSSI